MKRLVVVGLVSMTFLKLVQASPTEPIPESIFGTYKAPVNICEVATLKPEGYDNCTTLFDTVAIRRKSRSLAYVGITLAFTNYTRCHFYGIGRWKDNSLIASAVEPEGNRICRLQLTFDERGISMDQLTAEKEGWPCSSFCGSRGNLGTVQPLPRAR